MMLLPMFTTIILLWFILLTVNVDSRSCARTATPEVISSSGNNQRLSTIPLRRVIRQDINQQIGPAVIASSSPYSRLFQSFIYQSAPESESYDNSNEIIDQSINKPAEAKQHDLRMANRGSYSVYDMLFGRLRGKRYRNARLHESQQHLIQRKF